MRGSVWIIHLHVLWYRTYDFKIIFENPLSFINVVERLVLKYSFLTFDICPNLCKGGEPSTIWATVEMIDLRRNITLSKYMLTVTTLLIKLNNFEFLWDYFLSSSHDTPVDDNLLWLPPIVMSLIVILITLLSVYLCWRKGLYI